MDNISVLFFNMKLIIKGRHQSVQFLLFPRNAWGESLFVYRVMLFFFFLFVNSLIDVGCGMFCNSSGTWSRGCEALRKISARDWKEAGGFWARDGGMKERKKGKFAQMCWNECSGDTKSLVGHQSPWFAINPLITPVKHCGSIKPIGYIVSVSIAIGQMEEKLNQNLY